MPHLHYLSPADGGLCQIHPHAFTAAVESGQTADDEESLAKLLRALGQCCRRCPEPGGCIVAGQGFTLVGHGAGVGAEVSEDEAQRPDALDRCGRVVPRHWARHQQRPDRGVGTDAGQHLFAGNDSGDATRAVREEESAVGGIPQIDGVRYAFHVALRWEERAVAKALYQEAACLGSGWSGLGGSAPLQAERQRTHPRQERPPGMEGSAARLRPSQSGNGTVLLRRHGLAPHEMLREREQVLDAVSRSGNRIAFIAIVMERDTEETILAQCLPGMIHAHNALKPRMPRLGTEQMRYMRSRPWRPRGPWFDNRAGARRRGRRADELVVAVSDELHVQDGVAPADVEVIEAEDVLLSTAPAWSISERMPAAWVVYDRASSLATNGSGHDRALQPIDQLLEAEAVFTAHMLASQSNDSATAHSSSSSRQSA